MLNVYRNNPSGDLISILQQRKALYKNGPHYKAATRNPAFCKLTGNGDGGRMTVPDYKNIDTFPESQYNTFKPYPSLEEVNITYSPTEYGSKEGISWTIKCFTREDFIAVEAVFCRYGTKISVEFGYPKHWNVDQQSIQLDKFMLVTYEFNTDDEGSYLVRGSAVRASEALKKLELQVGGKFAGLFYQSGGKQFPVTGITELMTFDAQQNGQKAIDDIDLAGNDGVTFVPNKNHSYKGGGPGAVIVYKSSHKTLFSGRISKAWQSLKEGWGSASSVTSSVNLVYYSLEYIVNRLIMGHCHLKYSSEVVLASEFNPTAIVFDPLMSLSYPDIQVISGLPSQCVFCGLSKGKYLGTYAPGDELGIDFERVGGAGVGPITACITYSGPSIQVDPKKIILERSAILDAFDEAAKDEDSNSDKINEKSESEQSINVLVFLKKIFKVIKEASGGSIVLGITQHPEKQDYLMIFDQRNGYSDTLQCVVFNGIDGDGSSRSINLRSNAGSPEMASSIMSGQTSQGDPVHNVRPGKTGEISSKRSAAYKVALVDRDKLIKNPGNLIDSRFEADKEQALQSTINSITISKPAAHIKKYDLPTYPGLELDVTMDGVYGWRIGNAISSNHLTPNYEANKAYFMVRSVQHTFSNNSDWQTTVSGLLTFYDSINYVHL